MKYYLPIVIKMPFVEEVKKVEEPEIFYMEPSISSVSKSGLVTINFGGEVLPK